MRTSIATRFESEGFWPAIQRRIAAEAEPPADRGLMWRQSQRDALDADGELMRLLEGLLAAAPEHLPALFRRGRRRLERGDEAGIGDLERVIAADPSATLPGCHIAWQFYRRRGGEGDAPQAEAWQKRWLERSAHENAVNAELSQLPADATLAPHDLPEDRLAIVRDVVAGSATHIRRAYLLCRIQTSEPACHDYVVCIGTARFTLGNKGPAVIKQFAALEWPVHVFVVHLGSDPFKRFRKTIDKQKIAPIDAA